LSEDYVIPTSEDEEAPDNEYKHDGAYWSDEIKASEKRLEKWTQKPLIEL